MGRVSQIFYPKQYLSCERSLLPSTLPWLISYLENPQTYSDEEVRRHITEFCKELEGKTMTFEIEMGIKDELLLLSEFSALFPIFTPNWIIATIYLTGMEIIVKKELQRRGKELKDKFKDNFRLLLSCLKEEGVEVAELDKLLTPILWDLRNKVIHEGYSPTDEELKIIREHVTKLMEKLTQRPY